MKMRIIGVLAVCFLMVGCTSWERTTFVSLSASHALIVQAKADYTAGTIQNTKCTATLIDDAQTAQNAAVNAMVVYETAKTASNQAAATLALADIVPLIAQVKTIYTNPSGCKLP
jgi:hypothetical protein